MTAPILPVVPPQPESIDDGRHPPRRNRPQRKHDAPDDEADADDDESETPAKPPKGIGRVDVVA